MENNNDTLQNESSHPFGLDMFPKVSVHKKSLLLSGVCEVQGNFSAKDPVNIFNLQHELIGVGLAAQSAQALRVLLQQSEANGHTRAVIHRDDLFLADGHL